MKPLIFDIETVPESPERLRELMPPFDPGEVKTGNIKDKDKLLEKLLTAKKEAEDAFFKKAALHANTGRVAMIGYVIGESFFYYDGRESDILISFWDQVINRMKGGGIMAGLNIFEFDLRFIIRRSWLLDLEMPMNVRRGRYWNDIFVDIRDMWLMGERTPQKGMTSLDGLSRYFGFGPVPSKGEVFHTLTKDQQIEYLENDVRKTSSIFWKMSGKVVEN